MGCCSCLEAAATKRLSRSTAKSCTDIESDTLPELCLTSRRHVLVADIIARLTGQGNDILCGNHDTVPQMEQQACVDSHAGEGQLAVMQACSEPRNGFIRDTP